MDELEKGEDWRIKNTLCFTWQESLDKGLIQYVDKNILL